MGTNSLAGEDTFSGNCVWFYRCFILQARWVGMLGREIRLTNRDIEGLRGWKGDLERYHRQLRL